MAARVADAASLAQLRAVLGLSERVPVRHVPAEVLHETLPPDGYTLLMMSNTHTVNESLIHDKPFKLLRDFVPVAPVNSSDLVLVVHPSVPAIEKWARIVKISGASRDR